MPSGSAVSTGAAMNSARSGGQSGGETRDAAAYSPHAVSAFPSSVTSSAFSPAFTANVSAPAGAHRNSAQSSSAQNLRMQNPPFLSWTKFPPPRLRRSWEGYSRHTL